MTARVTTSPGGSYAFPSLAAPINWLDLRTWKAPWRRPAIAAWSCRPSSSSDELQRVTAPLHFYRMPRRNPQLAASPVDRARAPRERLGESCGLCDANPISARSHSLTLFLAVRRSHLFRTQARNKPQLEIDLSAGGQRFACVLHETRTRRADMDRRRAEAVSTILCAVQNIARYPRGCKYRELCYLSYWRKADAA